MCGIVGYVGVRDAGPILLDCLKRLEYRGYDSAGVGIIRDGHLEVRRMAGKVANLERVLNQKPVHGSTGLGHTRWATHGRPCDQNAHPHSDCSSSVAVVHNGIIENYRLLKATLEAQGHLFLSETDSEVVAHLVEEEYHTDLVSAARRALARLKGAYALGIMSQREPDKLVAIRAGGPPLVVGLSPDGFLLSSDISAILGYSRDVYVLEDGEMAVLSKGTLEITTIPGAPVKKAPTPVPWDVTAAERGGFPHFMLKEIHEQPRAIEDTYRDRIDLSQGDVHLPEVGLSREAALRIDRVVIVACGTSWHAALVGKHLIESLCRLPVEVDIASEFRYRDPLVDGRTMTVTISQSGETADTLGAMEVSRSRGSRILAICNVVGSSASRSSDGVLYTRAGPEIGVASTKAFTTQLVALYLLAIHLGRLRGRVSERASVKLLQDLVALPELVRRVLSKAGEVQAFAETLHSFSSFLYLGRGILHPLALEGALKLKEISYIHAEGYPAGEMKHGPIALIDPRTPVVVLAPEGRLREKVLGNLEEVKARDGLVLAFATEGDEEIAAKADHIFYLPRTSEWLLPPLFAVPLQLLAYHVGVLRHCDVDQPRNLAKSVTVE
jgi:glucosamine--fructose-6-phosphate aminotransferase (isomerizing)